ncbi:MAG: hypothetical protein R8L53_04680 [Mariprofundales bacterium]
MTTFCLLYILGCSSDPTPTPTTTAPTTTAFNIQNLGPVIKGNQVVAGAVTFGQSMVNESIVTSLANITFDPYTGNIAITNGAGVRGYELSVIHDTYTSAYSFTDGGFIGNNPSVAVGNLATIQWTGTGTFPILLSAALYAANGNAIPVNIKQ